MTILLYYPEGQGCVRKYDSTHTFIVNEKTVLIECGAVPIARYDLVKVCAPLLSDETKNQIEVVTKIIIKKDSEVRLN